MASGLSSSSVEIKFVWEGSNKWFGGVAHGGSEVRVVDLISKEVLASVYLPEYIGSASSFPLTLKEHHEKKITLERREFTVESEEVCQDLLSMTIEQVKKLVLRVGVVKRGLEIGKAREPFTGRIISKYDEVISVQEVKVAILEELEAGQTYRLTIRAEGGSFSAQLIEDRVEECKESETSSLASTPPSSLTHGISGHSFLNS